MVVYFKNLIHYLLIFLSLLFLSLLSLFLSLLFWTDKKKTGIRFWPDSIVKITIGLEKKNYEP